MNKLFSFVSMCALLFVVYYEITYIKHGWCQDEISIIKNQISSIYFMYGLNESITEKGE
mgnify:CR=1 FL=1